MRSIFITILLTILLGCTPKPNPIGQLLIEFKDHISDLWMNGNPMDLPSTATPLELIKSALELEGYHSLPIKSLKVKSLRFIADEIHPQQPEALVAWIKVDDDEKVLVLKYDGLKWYYRIYKVSTGNK